MKTTYLAIFPIALLILASSLSGKAEMTNNPAPDPAPLSTKDLKFVKQASMGGQMEVAMGQIAANNAGDSAVRDFANRMVQDHQKANQELTDLVTEKGTNMPAADMAGQDKMAAQLQNLKGSDFDKVYMKHMVSDHKATVALFQHEADRGDNPELRAWANKTLPTLQAHFAQAKEVNDKISGKSSSP